jgi:orotate phosphoribosyltransferase-like protein
MARKDANPGQSENAAQRRVRALELRIAGKRYRSIATELDVSEATIRRDVRVSLAELNAQEMHNADDYRREMLEQTDRMLEEAMRQVELNHVMVNHGTVVLGIVDEGAKLTAITTALKLLDRKAKLLGLDAPIEQKQSGTQEIIVRYADDPTQREK